MKSLRFVVLVVSCLGCLYILLVLRTPSDVIYVDLQDSEDGIKLQACLDKAAQGTHDEDCVQLLRSYLQSSHNKETDSIAAKDNCYSDIDILSSKPHPFPNITHMRLNYLDSLTQCGHTPKLMSRYVPRTDNLSLPVPNVVHFIWTHWPNEPPRAMGFHHHMAILSASKYIKPLHVLFHCTYEPFGYWWNRTVALVPNLYYVKWELPETVFGKPLKRPSFKSDVVRLWLLIVHGGMYFDLDVIILKSFDPLRVYHLVEGRELRFTLANGIIAAAPGSIFLRMALQAYKNFEFYESIKASMMFPNIISRLFPQHIHEEKKDLLFPTWPYMEQLYTEPYNWSDNYCIHIFGEQTYGYLIPENKEEMDRSNVTVARVLKQVYYAEDTDD